MPDAPTSAPGGREVVVLRPGPPKGRGLLIDSIVGILGVALLVMAAVLGAILPEEENPPRQFKVTYPQDGVEALVCCAEGQTDPALSARETASMPEGQPKDYAVFVEHDNAYQFQVTLSVTRPVGDQTQADDISASEPDSFSLVLLDPDGVERGNLTLVTKPPVRNPEQGQTPLYISPGVSSGAVSMRYAAKPGSEFVAVNDTSVTKAEVLRSVSENRTMATAGEWTVRITVVDAGDCPQPGPDPQLVQRAAECQQQTDNTGEDPGNPYTLAKVRYDYYTIEVASPEEQSESADS